MTAPIVYEKDGYLFADPFMTIIPWPIARIDKQGNKTSLSMEEIDAWQEKYFKEHPEVQARLDWIEEDSKITGERNRNIKPCLIERLLLRLIGKYFARSNSQN